METIEFKKGLQAVAVRHLALRLAEAEHSLQVLTSGSIDAVVDPSGRTYLLRPAQEQLRQDAGRLQAVIESAADVITVIDRQGLIISQSRAATRVLGYAPGELIGTSLFELVHQNDLPDVHCAFFNVIEEFQKNATVQFRHQTRAGAYRTLEATMSKVRDVPEKNVVMACRDITERIAGHEDATRREAAIEEASHVKNQFLAVLSHELRTPLTPALFGVQALEADPRFEEAKSTLSMIRRNIELQAGLIDNLLDFTRISYGKMRTKVESIDAYEAVNNVLDMCQSEIAAQQIAVRLGLRAAESNVRANSTELQQILWNLVRNAVKFSEPGGRIEISFANDASGQHTVAVVDHGLGIEPALLPRVFDSFQQGDRMAQQQYGGLGLGLFIAKTLAEAQEGTLTVESEGRGKGATFRLTLQTTGAPEPPTRVIPAAPRAHVRILLVEDHADTRTVLTRLLGMQGHTVHSAADTSSALELAATCEFDLLISDIGLPDGTGYDLMEKLHESRPSLKGIALSGFGMPSDIDESREAGFSEHLVKPINLDSLQSAIQSVAAAAPAGSEECLAPA